MQIPPSTYLTMALSKKEKLTLLAAISFFHNIGENYIDVVKNGTKEENKAAWKEARKICKELHARIKSQL